MPDASRCWNTQATDLLLEAAEGNSPANRAADLSLIKLILDIASL